MFAPHEATAGPWAKSRISHARPRAPPGRRPVQVVHFIGATADKHIHRATAVGDRGRCCCKHDTGRTQSLLPAAPGRTVPEVVPQLVIKTDAEHVEGPGAPRGYCRALVKTPAAAQRTAQRCPVAPTTTRPWRVRPAIQMTVTAADKDVEVPVAGSNRGGSGHQGHAGGRPVPDPSLPVRARCPSVFVERVVNTHRECMQFVRNGGGDGGAKRKSTADVERQ